MRLIQGPELRTIFLGFDSDARELLKSDVKGKNPFQDKRVRQAFYEAIDIKAIQQRVMRGQSHPTGLMYGPGVNGYRRERTCACPMIPTHAKKLLAEAGYPNGFGVTLDCPNDRYVNDEAICQAVDGDAGAHRHEGDPERSDPAQVFRRDQQPGLQHQLLHAGLDARDLRRAQRALQPAGSRNGTRGIFNDRRLVNPRIDELLDQMRSRPTRRSGKLIEEAVEDPPGRCGLHPAAPAEHGLGGAQEHRAAAAAPTTPSRCATSA